MYAISIKGKTWKYQANLLEMEMNKFKLKSYKITILLNIFFLPDKIL